MSVRTKEEEEKEEREGSLFFFNGAERINETTFANFCDTTPPLHIGRFLDCEKWKQKELCLDLGVNKLSFPLLTFFLLLVKMVPHVPLLYDIAGNRTARVLFLY